MSQFGYLDRIQANFDRHFPSLDIQIMGVGERGYEWTNHYMCDDNDLPWLQDVDADGDGLSDVWQTLWEVNDRDLIILDQQNEVLQVINLNSFNLGDADNYDELRNTLIYAAATPAESDWQHPIEPLDVNNNEQIDPLDALLVINKLGEYPDGLPSPGPDFAPPPYIDPTGDNQVGPLDAMLVINLLTEFGTTGPTATASVVNSDLAINLAPVVETFGAAEVDGTIRMRTLNLSSHEHTTVKLHDAALAEFDRPLVSIDTPARGAESCDSQSTDRWEEHARLDVTISLAARPS